MHVAMWDSWSQVQVEALEFDLMDLISTKRS